jgi:hypothetical protein
MQGIVISLVALWCVNLGKVTTRISTGVKEANHFGVERNDPAPAIILWT